MLHRRDGAAAPRFFNYPAAHHLSGYLFVDAQSGLLYVSVNLKSPDSWIKRVGLCLHGEWGGQKCLGDAHDDL